MCDNGITTAENALSVVKGVLDNIPAFVFVVNNNDELLYHNNLYCKYAGHEDKRFIEQVLYSDINSKEIGQNESKSFLLKYMGKNFKITITQGFWVNNNNCRIATGFDISDIMNYDKIVLHQSLDEQTGVYSKQAACEFLEEEISKLKTFDTIFTVCYLKINGIEEIFNKLTQKECEDYIKTLISVISNSIRQTDVFARISGDEFLLIFPKCRYEVVDNIMGTVVTRFEVINETSDKPYIKYLIDFGILEVVNGTDITVEAVLSSAKNKVNDD